MERHVSTVEGWEILTPVEWCGSAVRAGSPPNFKPLVLQDRPLVAEGVALQADGLRRPWTVPWTISIPSEPLELDHEDQYRRSEEPYAGPEEFSARALVNWSDEGLYLGIDVMKPEVVPARSHKPRRSCWTTSRRDPWRWHPGVLPASRVTMRSWPAHRALGRKRRADRPRR